MRPPPKATGEVPKHRSSKDTKRWCLGRVGREHVKRWTESRYSRTYNRNRNNVIISALACANCRKEFEQLWPGFGEWQPALRRYAEKQGPAF